MSKVQSSDSSFRISRLSELSGLQFLVPARKSLHSRTYEGRTTMKNLLLATVTLVLASALTSAYAQTYSVLYNFGSKAGDPLSPANSGIIAQGRDGNLYSTTPAGCT